MSFRAACRDCGQVYIGWSQLDTKCERCGGEVIEYEVDGLDEVEQEAAEKIVEVLERKSVWT